LVMPPLPAAHTCTEADAPPANNACFNGAHMQLDAASPEPVLRAKPSRSRRQCPRHAGRCSHARPCVKAMRSTKWSVGRNGKGQRQNISRTVKRLVPAHPLHAASTL
jgi:hypothetical protein